MADEVIWEGETRIMDQHRVEEVAGEEPLETDVSENSRREFITKLVTTVGVAAAAGLVSSGADAAVDLHKIEAGAVETHKDTVTLKMGKLRNGFRLTMTGAQIGEALRQVGVVRDDGNLANATVTIEFSV